jgi:hypothetical protein
MGSDDSKVQINQISPIAAALTGGNTITITGYIKVTTAFGTATSSSTLRIEFAYP